MVSLKDLRPLWFCRQAEAYEDQATAEKCLACLTRNSEPPNQCNQHHPSENRMHVRIDRDGPWHRLTINSARMSSPVLDMHTSPHTACGQAVVGYYGTREESYGGTLCRLGCFPAYEQDLARDLNAIAAAKSEEADAQSEIERDQRFEDLAAKRAAKAAEKEGVP